MYKRESDSHTKMGSVEPTIQPQPCPHHAPSGSGPAPHLLHQKEPLLLGRDSLPLPLAMIEGGLEQSPGPSHVPSWLLQKLTLS